MDRRRRVIETVCNETITQPLQIGRRVTTTIATDGKTIAADGLRCAGSERVSLTEKKIRIVNGTIYALTGDYACFNPAIKWHRDGADPGKQPPGHPARDGGWSLIVIGEDGRLVKYSDKLPYAEPFPYPATFGIDADYAMAAMHCGKSPREAVELAAKLGVYTGGEIMVVDIATALAGGVTSTIGHVPIAAE